MLKTQADYSIAGTNEAYYKQEKSFQAVNKTRKSDQSRFSGMEMPAHPQCDG